MQDILKLKSSFVLITSGFSCRNSNWYLGHPVTPQGARVKVLTSFYGLNQLIKTPSHLLQNSAICIDPVFTNQPYFVMESGVHSSLSSTCHHEIVFAKLNLKVEYPPPYVHVFWNHSRTDKASINRAINAIDWDELFANKTVESQVSELNDLLLNIYSNYIPNKTVLCDDKYPSWMTNGISTSAKTYWSILKTFANGRKVPVIPPLLINNEFISSFKTKGNYFNTFFNHQCT